MIVLVTDSVVVFFTNGCIIRDSVDVRKYNLPKLIMTHVYLCGGELTWFLLYFSIRSSWRTTPTLVRCWLEQTAIRPMEVCVFPLCLCQNISRSWKIHLQEDLDINVYWAFCACFSSFPNTVGGNLVIYKLFCWWQWRETEKKVWGWGVVRETQ